MPPLRSPRGLPPQPPPLGAEALPGPYDTLWFAPAFTPNPASGSPCPAEPGACEGIARLVYTHSRVCQGTSAMERNTSGTGGDPGRAGPVAGLRPADAAALVAGGSQGHDLFHHLLSGHYFARQLWQGNSIPAG